LLNLPMRVVEYSTRDGMVGETSHAWLGTVRNALVVDDIADSGRTLNYIQDINPHLPTAVLIQKELSDHMATFHGKYESGLAWIVFPWEIPPQ
jgi:hypoxanthine phosphoribosyltransferase